MRDHLIIGTNILFLVFPPKHLIKSRYNQKTSIYTISNILCTCDLDPNYKMTPSVNRLAVFLSLHLETLSYFMRNFSSFLLLVLSPFTDHPSCSLPLSPFRKKKIQTLPKRLWMISSQMIRMTKPQAVSAVPSSSSFCFERLSLNFLSFDPNMKCSFQAWDVDFSGTLFINS